MVDHKRDAKGRFVSNQESGLRTLSALVQRLQLANIAGMQFEGKRNLYEVFGYEKNVTPEQLLAKYQRQDIVSRIVDAPPGATWSDPPKLVEGTPYKEEFEALAKRVKLWNAMYRVDRLARLNKFAILFFGFDDTANVEKPVGKVRDLLYARAIGARQVEELTYDSDPRSPRFGQPVTYRIKFDDPASKTASGQAVTLSDFTVHYSRVVHVVENPLEDLVMGTPIVEKCYNLLDDLLKVAGGTAETYWLTGNRGMQADIDKDMDIDPADAAALSDEIEEYQHQLRRIIRTRGVNLNVLDSKTPDPNNTYEMIMGLLSGTTGIPRRILLGSEAGQLASEQDRANWAERIEERRALFAQPWILEPSLELLQGVGLLGEGEGVWEWPSAFIQNPLERSQTMAQTARAIGNISRQTGNQTPMPFVTREEARDIIGLPDDLTDEEAAELAAYMETEERDDGSMSDEDEEEQRAGDAEDEATSSPARTEQE